MDSSRRPLLGGDLFDFHSAPRLVKDIPWIDGIVVGYGEEVLGRIVDAHHLGKAIADLPIRGLINRATVGSREGADTARNGPEFHWSTGLLHPSYVKRDWAGNLRLLTQRGCSWGKCTFCNVPDRRSFLSISQDHLLGDTSTTLAAMHSEPETLRVLDVKVDSDENSLERILPLIECLHGFDRPGTRFRLSFWLMVRSFGRKLPELLRDAGDAGKENVNVHTIMNAESFSLDTLRHMQKGCSPLAFIEGAKALLDCGHTVQTNYFMSYPLENAASVAQEVGLLKRVVHLLVPPGLRIYTSPYLANSGDDISESPDKFGIRIKRRPLDPWIREVFCTNFHFSRWAYTFDRTKRSGLGSWIAYTYDKTLQARTDRWRATAALRRLGVERKGSFRQRLVSVVRYKKYYTWFSLHLTLQCRAYRQRWKLLQYITKVAQSQPSSRPSHFFLRDGFLSKGYNAPGTREKWSLFLTESELRVLRYLYWVRKKKSVFDCFEDEMSESEISEILERHIRLGSIVQLKTSLLSVVNDPGYWKDPATGEKEEHSPVGWDSAASAEELALQRH